MTCPLNEIFIFLYNSNKNTTISFCEFLQYILQNWEYCFNVLGLKRNNLKMNYITKKYSISKSFCFTINPLQAPSHVPILYLLETSENFWGGERGHCPKMS